MYICINKLAIIGSDNGLSPGRCQAIIWTNAGILLIGPLGTNFSEILIEIYKFSFKKMHLKMSSGYWRPSCVGLNVLNLGQWVQCWIGTKPSATTQVLLTVTLKSYKFHHIFINSFSPVVNDDIIKWKHFPPYWPFVQGIHWSPVNSPHKGQRRGASMFPLICVWINGWVNNREARDLRCHHTHYDVIAMSNFKSVISEHPPYVILEQEHLEHPRYVLWEQEHLA